MFYKKQLYIFLDVFLLLPPLSSMAENDIFSDTWKSLNNMGIATSLFSVTNKNNTFILCVINL